MIHKLKILIIIMFVSKLHGDYVFSIFHDTLCTYLGATHKGKCLPQHNNHQYSTFEQVLLIYT